MNPISFDDAGRPRAIAKRLRAALVARDGAPALSTLLEVVARGFGHAHWQALSRSCRSGAGEGPDWDVEAVRGRLVAALVASGIDPGAAEVACAEALPPRRPEGRAPVGVAAAFERWLESVGTVAGRDDQGRPTLAFTQDELDAEEDEDAEEDDPSNPWFETLEWCADGSLSDAEALTGLCRKAVAALTPPEAPIPVAWRGHASRRALGFEPEGDRVGGFLDGFEKTSRWSVGSDREACLKVLEAWGERQADLGSFLAETNLVALLAAVKTLPDPGARDMALSDLGTPTSVAVGAILLRMPILGGVFAASRYPYAARDAHDGEALARHLGDLLVAGGLPFGEGHERRLPPLGRDGLAALERFPFRLSDECEPSEDESCPDVAATAVVIVAALGRLGINVAWTGAEAGALVTLAALCEPMLDWDRRGDACIDRLSDGDAWEYAYEAGSCRPTVDPDGLARLLAPHANRMTDLVRSLGLFEAGRRTHPSFRLIEAMDLLGWTLDVAAGLDREGRTARLRRRLHDRGLAAMLGEALAVVPGWYAQKRDVPRPMPTIDPGPSWAGPGLPPPPPLPDAGPRMPRSGGQIALFGVRVYQSYSPTPPWKG